MGRANASRAEFWLLGSGSASAELYAWRAVEPRAAPVLALDHAPSARCKRVTQRSSLPWRLLYVLPRCPPPEPRSAHAAARLGCICCVLTQFHGATRFCVLAAVLCTAARVAGPRGAGRAPRRHGTARCGLSALCADREHGRAPSQISAGQGGQPPASANHVGTPRWWGVEGGVWRGSTNVIKTNTRAFTSGTRRPTANAAAAVPRVTARTSRPMNSSS